MVYSSERKLCLSGWLKANNKAEYDTPLKLQKFLLFYEAFSKTAGEASEFDHLRGYKRGPVFSTVWGDYTKEKQMFENTADKTYELMGDMINIARAKKSAFIVKTLTETELSELTHKMNIWKSKEDRIARGERQVALDEKDFNDSDAKIMKTLDAIYSDEMVENSKVMQLDKHYFVFRKNDITKLTEEHFDTLLTLTEKETLINPVYVEIDEEGRLVVD